MKLQKEINFLSNIWGAVLLFFILSYYYKFIIWPITYLFVLSGVITIATFTFICITSSKKYSIVSFLKFFFIPIILSLIILIYYLKLGNYTEPELYRIIIGTLLAILIFYLIFWSNENNLFHLKQSHLKRIIVNTLFIISLINLLYIAYFNKIDFFNSPALNLPQKNTIAHDGNFFALYLLIGLLIILFDKSIIIKHVSVKYLIASIFIFTIVISGSRRGMLACFVILIYLFFYHIVLKKDNTNYRVLGKWVILIALFLFSIAYTSYNYLPKEKLLFFVTKYSTLIGINDKQYVERVLFETKIKHPPHGDTIIDFDTEFSKDFWDSENKKNNLKVIETEYGPGFMLKSNPDKKTYSLKYIGPSPIYYANHTYLISFKVKSLIDDKPEFNLGWKLNDGGRNVRTQNIYKNIDSLCDGWYNYSATYTFIDNHINSVGFITNIQNNHSFIIADFVLKDLDYNKGLPKYIFEMKWDKNLKKTIDVLNPPLPLTKDNLILNGNFEDGIKYWGYKSKDLIFRLDSADSKKYIYLQKKGKSEGSWSLLYLGRVFKFKKNITYELGLTYKSISHEQRPFFIGFWLKDDDKYINNLKAEEYSLNDGWKKLKTTFKLTKDYSSNVGFPINSQFANSVVYITDIYLRPFDKNISHEFYNNIQKPKEQNVSFLAPRLDRWKFALDIWYNDYSIYEKLIGNGFNYLYTFSDKYYSRIKKLDWPHNPFLSVLLYSGLIGLIIYIYFMYKVFYYYIKYRKEYGIFFIFFLITFFFAFFSSNSPFSPPIFGFFVLLPFFIHYIHEKDKVAEKAIKRDNVNA